MRHVLKEGSLRRLTGLLLLLVLNFPLAVCAQDDPEYRVEIGASIGTVTYLGDYNENILKGMQPMGAVSAKYKMNPRMSMGLTIGYGKLKGSDEGDTWYPETERYTFDKSLLDAHLHYEYNFWAYGTGREYRGAKRVAPFITLGLGVANHGKPEGGLAVILPIGAGVKCKIGERLNMTAEWRMHFAMSDKFDGKEDPYGISSSGLFKNTDGYSVLQMSITYDLWAKCKTCHNDRD